MGRKESDESKIEYNDFYGFHDYEGDAYIPLILCEMNKEIGFCPECKSRDDDCYDIVITEYECYIMVKYPHIRKQNLIDTL